AAASSSESPSGAAMRAPIASRARSLSSWTLQQIADVVLDPEVAAAYPNSAAVNKALHSLVELAESVSGPKSGSRRPANGNKRRAKG
ncbi:MAG: hypothetical protein LAP13_18780, partial [Acidobacteriia bacterium]|nr:hypothetical protein [Terriglobia bacterium]